MSGGLRFAPAPPNVSCVPASGNLYPSGPSPYTCPGVDKPPDMSLDKMLKAKDADYASKPEVKWNFTKFLIDKEGKVVARFEPTASMEEVGKAVAEQL